MIPPIGRNELMQSKIGYCSSLLYTSKKVIWLSLYRGGASDNLLCLDDLLSWAKVVAMSQVW